MNTEGNVIHVDFRPQMTIDLKVEILYADEHILLTRVSYPGRIDHFLLRADG